MTRLTYKMLIQALVAFRRQTFCLGAVLCWLWCTGLAVAQEGPLVGTPWNGGRGVTESVKDIMARDAARGPKSQQPPQTQRSGKPSTKRVDNPDSPKVSQWPPAKHADSLPDSFVDTRAGIAGMRPAMAADVPMTFNIQTTSTNFLGPTLAESGWYPPNAIGAVGPSQILVAVNGRIRTYNKSGVLDHALDTDTNTFFNSVRNSADTSDTRVVFDFLSQRWFVSMLNKQQAPNLLMLAVSSGPTISSLTSFSFFSFQQDLVGGTPNADTGLFADYPSLGVDNNAVYMGVNMFNSTLQNYIGATAYIINKADLLTGKLTVTAFRRIGSNLGNMFSPIGVNNMDPNATEGYFIGADVAQYGMLRIRRISTPGGTPTISGTMTVTVPSTFNPIAVPAQGSNKNLDPVDDRLMNAQIINGSLWTTHAIQVDSTGVGGGATGASRNGMRYYQINNLTTLQPTLVQSGTLFDPSPTNPMNYWVGSIVASGQGHVTLASSYASSASFAGAAFTGRLADDALGALSSPTVIATGAGAYNPSEPSTPYRWGDLSNMVVDPADNMTVWSFQEYTSATNQWGVRVTQYKAPGPSTPSVALPAAAPVGTTSSVTLTGLSTGGSGFYDPGPGFPNHISASVSGTGVTVNSVAYTDPTHITLNLTVASNASQTARTVTVTNPDGQSVTGAAIFTVMGPEAITLLPSTSTLPSGTAGISYTQTVTAAGGTAPYAFKISAGALPSGLSLNSTTGLISGTPATSGTATFTVQATDLFNVSGSTQFTLKIASVISNNINLMVNGRSYDPTPSPGFVGKYTLNTTLTNPGPALTTPVYLVVTTLNKNGVDQIPSQPDKLLSADNHAGVVGDAQQIAASLGVNQSTPLSLLFGIGSRQSFNIFFDVYTVMPGTAMTAQGVVFKPQAKVSAMNEVASGGAADTALSGSSVLVGHFEVHVEDGIGPSKPPDSDFTGDPLSNLPVITGPGPNSRPAAAVDPTISTHIAIAANDFVTRTVRVSTSQDGGFTWHDTTLSTSALGQSFGTAQNPSLAFDSTGRLSVVYSLTNPFDSANALVLSESSDGINFSPPTVISFHAAAERIVDSRPVVAIKANAGRYVAWDTLSLDTLQYSINLARSDEGGSFGPVTTVASNGLVSSPALALGKSSVYIGWDDWGFNSSPPYNSGGRLMMTSSRYGPTFNFDTPQQIAKTSIGFGQKIPAMPEKGVGPNLSLAVNPKNDDIYAAFADRGNGIDIFFAHSANGGKKWQSPITVNDDKSAADQFSPALAIDADGRFNVSFYDTRLSSTFETAHVFLARSSDGKSFTNDRLTTALSDDSQGNSLRDFTANLGDRTAVAITDGDALVAWTDTRMGNEDIFSSIDFDASGASVTGTGKILSSAGDYTANPALAGTAEFGFAFKYRKGSSIPRGDTTFKLNVPKLKLKFVFQSTSYDSLLITGASAQFTGSGKVNGAGDYSFLVTITDGDQPGAGGTDKFRIKIVDKSTGSVVYDNVPGAPDRIDIAAPEAITDGKIKVAN